MLSKRQQPTAASKKSLVTYYNPDSTISDQFRTIRANLAFLTEKGENHVFLITSPGMGEGKSTTTANLAVAMAQQKDKVLLIDANLKEPSIHSIFDIPNEAGLTNILMYDVKFEEVIYKTELETLDILTSGSTSFNPAELLGNKTTTELLKKVANTYDIVLIDSPSVLKFSETRVLANQCDGVVLVLNRDKTERKQAIEARRVLELAHAKLVGAIMNEA
jgi:capsular exopolysaccharide synthesis family protein